MKKTQVVDKLLKDDFDKVQSKTTRNRTSKKPRGYFHELFFAPEDWRVLKELSVELEVGSPLPLMYHFMSLK